MALGGPLKPHAGVWGLLVRVVAPPLLFAGGRGALRVRIALASARRLLDTCAHMQAHERQISLRTPARL